MALPGTISFRDKVLQHLENEPEVSSAIKLEDDKNADLSENTEENSDEVLSVESEDEEDDIMSDEEDDITSDDEDDDIVSDEEDDYNEPDNSEGSLFYDYDSGTDEKTEKILYDTAKKEETTPFEYTSSSDDNGLHSLEMSDSDSEQENETKSPSIHSTIIHKFTKKPYRIFDENHFQSTMEQPEKEHTFLVYIYVICNNTYNDPYLLVPLKYNKNSYGLPSVQYSYQQPSINKDDPQFDTLVRNKIFQEVVFPMFDITPEKIDDSLLDMKELVTGFYSLNESHTIVGIHGDSLVKYLKGLHRGLFSKFLSQVDDTKPSIVFSTIHEIRETQQIWGIVVDPILVSLLNENPWLHEIKNANNLSTKLPMVFYSCHFENHKVMLNMEPMIIPIKSNLGDEDRLYYFTQKNTQYYDCPRYVLFVDKIKESTPEKMDEFMNDIQYDTLRIMVNNIECYGVYSQTKFHYL